MQSSERMHHSLPPILIYSIPIIMTDNDLMEVLCTLNDN